MSAELMDRNVHTWGNATYVDCAVRESFEFLGKQITLISVENNYCRVRVGETEEKLIVARRALPTVIEGIRMYLADNKPVKNLTTDPGNHGLMQHDAFLCLSDASQPLLDPERYCFPISREDGYHWHMEESSHMLAYYGRAPWMESKLKEEHYYRSHEGIDFNLHDARGIEKHALVAIEAGIVRMVHQANRDEICIIVESESEPGIYYIYKHVYVKFCCVEEGQRVEKGERLAYTWGDGVWGHLHFAIVKRDEMPEYDSRYFDLLNCFPQIYELWHGDLTPRPKVWKEGRFTFGHKKWLVENKLRMAVYDEIVGYGWRIEDWCTAGAIDLHVEVKSGNLPLRKVMHAGTLAECENPHNFIEFEIAVEPGNYVVSAMVGDLKDLSWQQVSFCGVDAGTYELPAGHYQLTSERKVTVSDGRLIIRFAFRDKHTAAGISELHFRKRSD